MSREQLISQAFLHSTTMHRLISKRHLEDAKSHHVPSKAQMGILLMLADNSRNVAELAHCFGITPSAVTQLINGLHDDGLLSRTVDTEDRRKVSLRLTKKGVTAVKKIQQQREAFFGEILAPLTDKELAQLNAIQQKILSHFEPYEK